MWASAENAVIGRLRHHSAREQFADGCVHVVGLVAGLAGAVTLMALASAHSPQRIAAVGVYAGGLLAMLGASAAYNLAYATRFRAFLRRCDHSAIFLMIAGTYTPFTLTFIGGWLGLAATGLIWLLALGGIALRMLSPRIFARVNVGLYLALGWIAVLIIGPLLATFSLFTSIALVLGGALYTFGVPFHIWESLPFQNAIWHVFVLAAALCHYLAVLDSVVLRGTMV